MINLETRLDSISKVFDKKKILERDVKDPKKIAQYYRLNRPVYWLFLSRRGFVHLASQSKGSSIVDYSAPVDFVSKYIKLSEAHKVLELGAGKGGNLKYLAQRHSKVKFVGFDLPNGQFKAKYFKSHKNIDVMHGDYHDLKVFARNSIDLVFIIEALTHARNLLKVLQAISRILKPGGFLVILQDNLMSPVANLQPSEKLAFKLLHAGVMSAHESRYYLDLIENLNKAGMDMVYDEDITIDIQPALIRMDKQASWFIQHPKLLRVIQRILPSEITANVITPYLLRPMYDRGLLKYYLTVAKKSV